MNSKQITITLFAQGRPNEIAKFTFTLSLEEFIGVLDLIDESEQQGLIHFDSGQYTTILPEQRFKKVAVRLANFQESKERVKMLEESKERVKKLEEEKKEWEEEKKELEDDNKFLKKKQEEKEKEKALRNEIQV
jgi:hypothetical protein